MREELNIILAKESLNDTDISILVKNKGLLTQEELVRLGLAPAVVAEVKESITPEPVIESTPVVKKARSKKV